MPNGQWHGNAISICCFCNKTIEPFRRECPHYSDVIIVTINVLKADQVGDMLNFCLNTAPLRSVAASVRCKHTQRSPNIHPPHASFIFFSPSNIKNHPLISSFTLSSSRLSSLNCLTPFYPPPTFFSAYPHPERLIEGEFASSAQLLNCDS